MNYFFEKNECEELISILDNNNILFNKAFSGGKSKIDTEINKEICLPVLTVEIYYKNIFDKCYKLLYDRGMFKFIDIETKGKKAKEINFISENTSIFSLKKISKRKQTQILKEYGDSLPFIKDK